VSRARLFRSLKALDVGAVAELLAADRALLRAVDDRKRTPLHFLCSLPPAPAGGDRAARLARLLLDAGADIDAPAFTEGTWHATPLWYAVSRGENVAMARFLLQRGAKPEHCLWAAAFRDNVEVIDLLARHGARIDPVAEDETPFLSAVKTSHFAAAERLLRHGANANFQDSKGRTALHFMLRKDSPPKHVEMVMRHGADPSLRAKDGTRPLDLVARRRDKTYLDLLTRARRPR
jgi:ankyrin repeat protein